MSEHLSSPGVPDSDLPFATLTDRVLARVSTAARVVDRRAHATRQSREARSLRRVFLDMGDAYRDYRRRTGEPVAADVRAAAERFRRERNLTALVSVAALLEQHEILTL